jgi:isocitrate lyase
MDQRLLKDTEETSAWFKRDRFKGIERLYSPRQVAEQRGCIENDYTIAKTASEQFFDQLREMYSNKKAVTTYGPYSPGQAVMMRKQGIQGIYLGGWATSAKGSDTEDPGADLASYPLSRVPDEAAAIVRSLVAADRNQYFARSRMTEDERKSAPTYDYRPFIIADADTGHGGDAHVRNLIKRFVEVGVTGYHIEDQKPGTKKCGHQGGKVIVPADEQIKRLNAARFQLDIMKVAGLIVARTDTESGSLLEKLCDERDHPFVMGATNEGVPSYRDCHLNTLKAFYDAGLEDVNGHKLYKISDKAWKTCDAFFKEMKLTLFIQEQVKLVKNGAPGAVEDAVGDALAKVGEVWEAAAGVKTLAMAVHDLIKMGIDDGAKFEITPEAWLKFAGDASISEAKEKAASLGLDVVWNPDLLRTPDGYYQVKGSIDFAIARSLAVAPYCDLLWMETKTANVADAKRFADAIHAVYPDKMLAYNLSPSFNWDTTGMNDAEMTDFPTRLAECGFVFNFITYGGHQIDGLASEEFAHELQNEGMLALAKLQRRLRLIDSPYKTPQTLVGGKRFDGALTASSGRTAATVAMGKGSTQFQHLVQTEVPLKQLDHWLSLWLKNYEINDSLHARLRPMGSLSDLMELTLLGEKNEKHANVIFTNIQDRQGRHILAIRNQGTHNLDYRQKRLMTLAQSFLVLRYKAETIHYLSPTEDNHRAVAGMKKLGFFDGVRDEVGDIIVANVDENFIPNLLMGDDKIIELIGKS